MRTGHADVGLKGRPVFEDLFVGRGNVRMSAERGRIRPNHEIAARAVYRWSPRREYQR